MNDTNKLYLVTLRGFSMNITGPTLGSSYVVAKNTDEAYQKVRNYLDQNDFGYKKDRELYKIELLAENYNFTNVGTILFE